MNYFAKNIKYLRKKNGYKINEMIEVLGFKPSTWNGYELGTSQPYIDGIIKISEFFKIAESDLLHTDLEENASLINNEKAEIKQDERMPKRMPKRMPNYPKRQHYVKQDIVVNEDEMPYQSKDDIIKTLSAAVKGLEASNAQFINEIKRLQEENNRLKKELPAINPPMEDNKAQSA